MAGAVSTTTGSLIPLRKLNHFNDLLQGMLNDAGLAESSSGRKGDGLRAYTSERSSAILVIGSVLASEKDAALSVIGEARKNFERHGAEHPSILFSMESKIVAGTAQIHFTANDASKSVPPGRPLPVVTPSDPRWFAFRR